MAEDSVKTFKRDGVRVNLIADARNALLKMITGWRTTSQNAAFLVSAPDVASIEPAECPVDATKLDRKQKGRRAVGRNMSACERRPISGN